MFAVFGLSSDRDSRSGARNMQMKGESRMTRKLADQCAASAFIVQLQGEA